MAGTDTGVGKTLVSAMLCLGLGADYWKPVQSGSVEGLDSTMVSRMSGLGKERVLPERYVFRDPLSPHLAARNEGGWIDPERLCIPGNPGRLIVEGAGGLMVPLNNDFLMIDLIRELDIPVLVVASNRLGTINHTLLTVKALASAKADILGVVLNKGINPDHKEAIEHFGQVKVLAQLGHFETINPEILQKRFNELFL